MIRLEELFVSRTKIGPRPGGAVKQKSPLAISCRLLRRRRGDWSHRRRMPASLAYQAIANSGRNIVSQSMPTIGTLEAVKPFVECKPGSFMYAEADQDVVLQTRVRKIGHSGRINVEQVPGKNGGPGGVLPQRAEALPGPIEKLCFTMTSFRVYVPRPSSSSE